MNAATTTPRVSVTLTTYNRLHYLPQAVESVLNQTYRDFELIVVENGSTDGTREWLEANPRPNLRVIYLDENIGATGGMNTGIRAATGEYLTWLGSDDYFASYHLEAFVAALDSAPGVDYAYAPYYLINANGEVESIHLNTAFVLRELITRSGHHRGNASFMYRRSLHDEIGLFEGNGADRAMWTKMLERYNYILMLEPTVYYRHHSDSATNTTETALREEATKDLRDFLERNGGGVNDTLLRRLYPGIQRSNRLIPYALSDFAHRMFNDGLPSEALSYLKVILSMFEIDDLLRPLLNFVALSVRIKLDPLPHIQEAVKANKHLTTEMQSAMVSVAQSMILFNRLNSNPEPYFFLIEHDKMPLKYDMPRVFSYTAWKNGSKLLPLPTV